MKIVKDNLSIKVKYCNSFFSRLIGFMFKRNKDNPYLTQTCDLIAPNGFGEILGCAEKMTDYDEIISSMKEKDKYQDFERYKESGRDR